MIENYCKLWESNIITINLFLIFTRMFGQGFNKKFGGGGWKDFGKGGSDFWGGQDRYEKKPAFGGGENEGGDAPDFEKKKIPGSGRPEDEENDEDGEDKKPEPKEEGDQWETIEQVLELFDQITPLIEKLRNRK